MSVEAIVWVLKQDIKPASAKHVLTVMANCANSIDFVCYPSIAYLTQATSQDRKTVIKNMAVLRQMGYIKDTGKLIGHTNKVHVYQLCQPTDEEIKAYQQQNHTESGKSTKNGTIPKTASFAPSNSTVFPMKQSQISAQTVPFLGHGKVKKENESTCTGTVPIPDSNSHKQKPPSKSKKIDDCPVEQIIDLFERHFPKGRKSIRPLNQKTQAGAKRIAAIRARWNEAKTLQVEPFGFSDPLQGLRAFDNFFKVAALSKFLRGEAEPSERRKPFVPNIDSFMSPSFFINCLEYKYHNDDELLVEDDAP